MPETVKMALSRCYQTITNVTSQEEKLEIVFPLDNGHFITGTKIEALHFPVLGDELLPCHAAVDAVACSKLLRAALLCDDTVLKDHDVVCIGDGSHPVGDDHDCLVFDQP